MAVNDRQKKAIEAPISNILVSAGAGCGKSTVLKFRVVDKILQKQLKLKNTIVLTFTKAAANEIRNKIKNEISKKYGADPTTWQEEYDYVDQASICTFDSFSQSIFSKYAYKLNMSKDINILDETVNNFLIDQYIEEAFNNRIDDPIFKNILDEYTVRDYQDFKKDMLILYNHVIDNQLDPVSFMDSYMFCFKQNNENVIEKYKKDKLHFIDVIKEKMNDFTDNEAIDRVEPYVSPLYGVKTYEELLSLSLTMEGFPDGKSNLYKEKLHPENYHAAKSIKEILSKLMPDELLSTKDLNDYLNKLEGKISVCFDIFKDVISKYNAYCSKNNAYTYMQIARLVIKILKENPDVLKEVRDSITEIYVDEYQDTSDIQEELLELISNNNRFMVGDIKQSIYRFRNANPDIFKDKFDNYGNNQGGTRFDLIENYRSRKEVLADINDLFDLLMIKDFSGIDYKKEHRLEAGNKDYSTSEKGILFHSIEGKIPGKNGKAKDRPIAEIRKETFLKVLGDIQYKMEHETINGRKLEYKDFAIISRSKERYLTYSRIAKKYNIPLDFESPTPFIRNTEMVVLTSILSMIIDINDKLSYFCILRSFLYECSDSYLLEISNDIEKYKNTEAYKLIEEFRLSKNHLTLYELVYSIIDKFEFFKKIRKLDDPIGSEGRLLFMLNKCKEFMAINRNYNDLYDYINKLITYKGQKELDVNFAGNDVKVENSVKLMTIHKSKGLEFSYVYFIETEAEVGKTNNDFVNYSKEYGLAFKESGHKDFAYNINTTVNKSEQINEDLRLFYVCLTRAIHQAIIFSSAITDIVGKETKLNKEISPIEISAYNSYDAILMSAYESIKIEDDHEPNNNAISIDKKDDNTKKMEFYQIEKLDEKIKEDKASHEVNRLISKKEKENLLLGSKLHLEFELFDFNKKDYSNVDKDSKEKIEHFIKNVIENKDIIDEDIIHYYKEHECSYNDTSAIMDLIIETKSKMIIIDYKTFDIDSPDYIKQLNTYKELLNNLTKKKVEAYLYSLVKGDIKRV